MKKCSKCGESDLAKFHNKSDNSYCKACQSLYAKQHYESNKGIYVETRKRNKPRQVASKRDMIYKLKENNPCIDCGKFYPYYVMQFDHLDNKQKEISNMISQNYAINSILNEVSKCELVCANCHRERTQKRVTKTISKRNTVVYIQQYKDKKVCADCKKIFDYHVLDFDHRNNEKKVDCIGFMVYYASLGAIKEEIQKCDLLCANCHSIRTHKRMIGSVAEYGDCISLEN